MKVVLDVTYKKGKLDIKLGESANTTNEQNVVSAALLIFLALNESKIEGAISNTLNWKGNKESK